MKVCFDTELIVRHGGRGPRYTSYPTALQFNEELTADKYRENAIASNASGVPLSQIYVRAVAWGYVEGKQLRKGTPPRRVQVFECMGVDQRDTPGPACLCQLPAVRKPLSKNKPPGQSCISWGAGGHENEEKK